MGGREGLVDTAAKKNCGDMVGCPFMYVCMYVYVYLNVDVYMAFLFIQVHTVFAHECFQMYVCMFVYMCIW